MTNATSSEVITLPKGGGALHGMGEKFSPDLHTGTGNFTVPIVLPPGRNGFQPQLNFVYSTGNGNGPFGLGWNLSIPGVSRKTSKGVPRYDEAKDVFILSGAEDLVPTKKDGVTTYYRPRTEGLFAEILYHRDADNSYWEVRSKDGLTSFYGTQRPKNVPLDWEDLAVIRDPDPLKLDHAFAWKLTHTEDPFGNLIKYDYVKDSAEDGPHHWDQNYLSTIRYVDYGDDRDNPTFLVRIQFDYEQRPDPFSEYRSGFEIRTRRRCTRITVHIDGDENQTVRTFDLIYVDTLAQMLEGKLEQLEDEVHADPANAALIARRDEAKASLLTTQANLPINRVSLLSQIKVTGRDGGKTESLPPLEFKYTRFEPQKRDFFPLQGSDLPARSLTSPDLELVDLFGNGLPDFVEMNGTTRYWRNLGNGRFDMPRSMQDAPAGLALADAGVQFIDANGDGRTDLLITTSAMSGYFPLCFDGQWNRKSFRRFVQAPSFNLEDPEVRLVDLDGDGVTDAIRSGSRLECFFNHPKEGWNETRWVERQALEVFPNVNFSDPRVKWADMTGDGLQDIVLVYEGNVEYWPDLGRGNWGKRVHMERSPRFPYGYDPRRILIGDVDGDGLADIVYVEDTKVTLWINQSGNRWSDPISILGTPPVSDVDAVHLIDVLGSGISGVLWSRDANSLSRDHLFFLDFTGGLKPYLLHEMDNHIGAVTKVDYAPSVRFYLDDQRHPETRWKTTLPFPVHVVSSVEVIDHFSKDKLTTEYRYHHGHWDGAEREFRGFGMVEQLDTESFEKYDSIGLHGVDAIFAKVDRQYFSQPILSKTWFQQGPVGDENGDWNELDWSEQYWKGDPQLLKHTETVNQFLKNWPTTVDGRRVKRDALRTLRGSILRTELYALDGSEREDRPYTVSESSYGLVEIEPLAGDDTSRLHIFYPHATSQRTTQWERGDDPMTQFSYSHYTDSNNKFDMYGRVLAQTQIACPRHWRKIDDVPNEPFLATYSSTVYAKPDELDIYIHNRVAKATSYEIKPVPGRTVLDIALFKETSTDLNIIGQTLIYYDGNAFEGLPLRKIGNYGAVTRTESFVLTDDILQQAYSAQTPPYIDQTDNTAWTPEYPVEFKTLLPRRAGYVFHAGSAGPSDPRGYFVNTSRLRYDFQSGSKERGLVFETLDPLHDKIVNPLAHRTLIVYDKYQFLPEQVTDAVGLTMQAIYDYRVLQPKEVIDPNGNKSLFKFTPLGLLESSFIQGKTPMEGDQNRPGVRIEYGFLAFNESPPENRQPIFVRSIRHTHHDTELDVPLPERDEIITTVEYSDGFGRLLQTRTQGEEVRFGDEHFGGGETLLPVKQAGGPGGEVVGRKNTNKLNPNVVVSGWQAYDNKGQVVEKYEPFYSEGWDYGQPEDKDLGKKIKMFFDPRGHAIRTLKPDGSEQRVIFGVPGSIATPILNKPDSFEPTPWEAYTYDANDLAPLSFDPIEKQPDGSPKTLASRVHVAHHFTPSSILIDALGRTIQSVELNRDPSAAPDSPVEEIVTQTAYDIRGNVLTITDALKRDAFYGHVYDYANRKLRMFSIDAGLRTTVFDAIGGVIEQRDSKEALILHGYDILNRPIRLWARDGIGQHLTLRERLEYGDAGTPDQPDVERTANQQANRLGQPYKHFDEAGLLIFDKYDFKGNLLEKTRRVVSDAAIVGVFNPPPPGWNIDAFRVDWDNPAATALDALPYTSTISFDALNRVKVMTYPEDVQQQRRKLIPHYNRSGALESVVLERIAAGGMPPVRETFVERIAYNAKGQRVLIAYGNRIMTRYAYDPLTFRLTHLRTEDFSKPIELTYRPKGQQPLMQEFGYDYDLLGNILGIQDRTPGSGIKDSDLGLDALDRKFIYDALYRLRSADGRECDRAPDWPWDDTPRCTDLTKTRSYTELYLYDAVGNIKQLTHVSDGGPRNRNFELMPGNNRLENVKVGQTNFDYHYDDNGNMIGETTSRHFEWDHADRLKVFRTQTDESAPTIYAHYLYDSSGQRVKKLVRKQDGQVEVTIYIDGVFEYQRVVLNAVIEENNTLHVMDNQSRIALVRIGNPFAKDTTPAVKYHLSDHLDNSNVVIDASGSFINREEFTPYGETSFGSFARKRYRFTGKERDEESGLYYHGARYYLAWLGRWATCDPAGMVDGLCLYGYARCNPLLLIDRSGTQSADNINGGDAGAPTPGGGSTEVAGATEPAASTTSTDADGSARTKINGSSGVTGSLSDLKTSPPKVYTRKINPNNPSQANPEIYGMKPTNPDSSISIGEHSLNRHNIPPEKGSRFLSLSELPEGASTVTGDLKYIEASKLPPDLKIHPNDAIAQDHGRLVQEGVISQEVADMWKKDQSIKEFEVMAEGPIPSSAITSKRPTVSPLPGGLSILGGGFQILGAALEENSFLKGAGYGAGGIELVGGSLYIAGGQLSSATLLVYGGGIMTAGGYGGIAISFAGSVRTRAQTAKVINETITREQKNGNYPSWFRELWMSASIGMAFSGM